MACDSSKLGQTAFSRVASLSEVDLVVTDTDLTEDMRRDLMESGIKLVVAAPDDEATVTGDQSR